MTLTTHIAELTKKHLALSDKVEALQRAPGANAADIAAIKKQKLRIKEEITRLSAND